MTDYVPEPTECHHCLRASCRGGSRCGFRPDEAPGQCPHGGTERRCYRCGFCHDCAGVCPREDVEPPEGPQGGRPDPRDVKYLQDAYDRNPWAPEDNPPSPDEYMDLR